MSIEKLLSSQFDLNNQNLIKSYSNRPLHGFQTFNGHFPAENAKQCGRWLSV